MDEKELDHRLEMAKESNNAAICYSEKSVLYMFYLNGGAATALFARAEQIFYPAATWFAIGAFLSVICMGLSYTYQMFITSSWYANPHDEKFIINSPIKQFLLSFTMLEKLRLVPILFWILAAACFVMGLVKVNI